MIVISSFYHLRFFVIFILFFTLCINSEDVVDDLSSTKVENKLIDSVNYESLSRIYYRRKRDQYLSPELCSLAKRWTHHGRDLVRDYNSNVLLISFVPLYWCSGEEKPCQNILQK